MTDLMIALGCKFEELVNKLKMDKQKAMKALMDKIHSLFHRVKDKNDEVHTNVYEALANHLLMLNEDDQNDEQANANNPKEKETDDKGASWAGLIGNAAKTILLQMFAYYGVTLILPAIITLIGGPIAGSIAESIGKIIWGSGVVFMQAKHERELHKSGEYDKKYDTKFKKFIHWTFFLFNIGWAAWKVVSSILDMGNVISALASGNETLIKSILPSEGVQNITTLLNKAWKGLIGKDAPGFTKMQEHIAFIEQGILEETVKLVKGTASGMTDEQIKQAFEQNHFKSSMDAIKYFQDKGMVSTLAGLKNLNGSATYSVFVDGFFGDNKWTRTVKSAWKAWGGTDSELAKLVNQSKNLALNAMNNNAGSAAVLNLPGNFLKYCGEHGISLGNKGLFSVLGTDGGILKVLTRVVHKVAPIMNHMDWFGGLFPIGSSKHIEDTVEPTPIVAKDGEGFRVRLGSENDKENYIYEIGKDGVKLKAFSEAGG